MSILFKKDKPQKSLPGIPSLTKTNYAPELRAIEPVIDVVKNFPWTLTPPSSPARKETPYIKLTEYYVTENAMNLQLKPYGFELKGTDFSGFLQLGTQYLNTNINRLYEGFYDLTTPSGFQYVLPMFSPEMYSTSSAWEKKDLLDTIVSFQQKALMGGVKGFSSGRAAWQNFKGAVKNLKKGAGGSGGDMLTQMPEIVRQVNMLKMQMNNPAVGLFDAPHVWRQSSPRQYSFRFYLYNIEATSQKEEDVNATILKNWELCYLLTYQNSMNKRNFFTGLPPVFYLVEIPGVHFCKASYIQNLQISNVGNVRKLRLPLNGGPIKDVNIPDMYSIDITIQDLLMPSKNLHDAVTNSSAAQRITTDTIATAEAREARNPRGD